MGFWVLLREARIETRNAMTTPGPEPGGSTRFSYSRMIDVDDIGACVVVGAAAQGAPPRDMSIDSLNTRIEILGQPGSRRAPSPRNGLSLVLQVRHFPRVSKSKLAHRLLTQRVTASANLSRDPTTFTTHRHLREHIEASDLAFKTGAFNHSAISPCAVLRGIPPVDLLWGKGFQAVTGRAILF